MDDEPLGPAAGSAGQHENRLQCPTDYIVCDVGQVKPQKFQNIPLHSLFCLMIFDDL